MDTAQQEREKEKRKSILLKELGEKAEKAAEVVWSESDKQDAVVELAQAECKVNDFFYTLSLVQSAGLEHTDVVRKTPLDALIAEMEELRDVVNKRKTGCLSCIRDHKVCTGPLGRRCNRCTRNKKKCSRASGHKGERADVPIIREDAGIENAADAPSKLSSTVIEMVGNTDNGNAGSQSITTTATDTSIKELSKHLLKAPSKSAISSRGIRVSDSVGKAQITGPPTPKRIRWLDLEGGTNPTKITELLQDKEKDITIPKKIFDDFRDAFLRMKDAVEDFRKAMQVIEQHGQKQTQ